MYSDAEIGKKTEFDEQGNTKKVIDYDKGYTICWAQAVAIGKRLAARDIKKHGLSYIVLDRKKWNVSTDFKPVWTIAVILNEWLKDAEFMEYDIDGTTGKLLKTRKAMEGTDDTF